MKEYARLRGFRAILKTTSAGQKWSGALHCHCWKSPSLRPVVSGDRIDCSCKWKVHCSKDSRTVPPTYHLTPKRFLQHTGHTPIPTTVAINRHYTSLADIPRDVRSFIVIMLKCNLTGEPRVKRYVEAVHQCTFDVGTFHNLLNQCKETAQVAHPSEDFHVLFEWLLKEIADNKGAFARLSVDEELSNELNCVLYMSSDMVYNLKRNGTVLIMDTTFKTNRFHWPLLLVCGINEHNHTVLFAVALLRYQDTSAFAWVLRQMAEACGEVDWARVSCVATDGDKAMNAAIEQVLPASRHLRCWYHIEQNMKSNLVDAGLLTEEQWKLFLQEWKSAALKDEEDTFEAAKDRLHQAFPTAVAYLTAWIWPNGDSFLICRIKASTTLGILSTQRVEGLNSTLKTSLIVGSKTPLVTLFSSLQYAAERKDRDEISQLHRQEEGEAGRVNRGSFQDTVQPFVSRWAAKKIRSEFDYITNYTTRPQVLGGTFHVHLTAQAKNRGALEPMRQVQVLDRTMKCSCGFPITYLLPCRHVLFVNNFIDGRPFRSDHVGLRWLRSFMPPPKYSPNPLLQQVLGSSLNPDTPLITSVKIHKMPNEKARYTMYERHGQDIARIMAPYKEFHNETEAFWVAALQWAVAKTSSKQPIAPPSADPTLYTPSALNATVPVECIPHPPLPNAIPGRPSEKRKRSRGESQPKRKRSGIPATQ